MKLAYVTTYDARNVGRWSGSGYFIGHALQEQGMQIAPVGPLRSRSITQLLGKANRLRYLPTGRRYLTGRTLRLAGDYANQVALELDQASPDLVFSPGSIPVSLLECRQPIAFWTDATFAGMLDYYPEYTNLCTASIRQGNAMEQSALDRCRLAIYASEWAARTALENYHVDPGKIRIVPFGANFESSPTEAAAREAIGARNTETCTLLLISVAWQRKGGDIVLEIAERARERGVPVRLAIVGELPPAPLPEYAHSYGFISKATPEGLSRLQELFRASHFLLMPSRAEAFGLAPAEANAFGVPALTSNTGGLDSVIRNGINGYKFDVNASAEEYADIIARLWNDKSSYNALALSSYQEFAERLNWGVAGQQVKALLETCI